MKRLVFFIVLVQLVAPAVGQSVNPNLQAMVDAEKAFIKMARTQNRRDAFLYYLSDSAVTQGPNGPIKGKARIQAQPIADDLLDWEVGYSDIAASGDFGFNTGPWYYRQKKTDEKPVAFGEFNSVWKKQSDGNWKNVLDIGISHGPVTEPITWSSSKKPSNGTKSRKMGAALAAEKSFAAELAKGRKAAYRKAIGEEVRMMVVGHLPFVGPSTLDRYLNACPPQQNARILGTETASSGDLGYVYGTVDATVTKDGKSQTKTATFVRIWKFEGGKWKIVLDVLTY